MMAALRRSWRASPQSHDVTQIGTPIDDSGNAALDDKIRQRVHSSAIYAIGPVCLVLSVFLNPFLQFQLGFIFWSITGGLFVTLFWISRIKHYARFRPVSFVYIGLLASGFRMEVNAMGDAGDQWIPTVLAQLIISTALAFNSKSDYLASCALIIFCMMVGGDQTQLALLANPLTITSIVCSVSVGTFLNSTIMSCLRSVFRTKEILHTLSMTDPLTGVLNRRALLQALTDALDAPTPRMVQFAIVDVDNFKSINDQNGHDVGDAVLIEFATTVRRLASPHLVGRLGGEEFGLIFVDTTAEQATELLQRMLEDVASLKIAGVTITFSGGLAQAVHPTEPATVMKLADLALYKAKTAGKARIMLANVEDRILDRLMLA
ncbi:GGDEF domain-containing protein [Agrobacterium larrymoorei]|uniref:diguanylate cyclase n=1 Tax=Agrobacterium larrymoorei TaxID=160699 RepID=A0ABU0UHC0_9HYPH|nr:GGDEF domain-containing protein [Agrobacterium larrymoorei]MDQ1184319.1 diguanylate cyclase (GGDEF)-like protein [Agrobacterium larrymoorei]